MKIGSVELRTKISFKERDKTIMVIYSYPHLFYFQKFLKILIIRILTNIFVPSRINELIDYS
jgi:hypothetical protein